MLVASKEKDAESLTLMLVDIYKAP